MRAWIGRLTKYKRLWIAAGAAAIVLVCCFCVYLTAVKETQDKTCGEYINDVYDGNPLTLEPDVPVSQTFQSTRAISAAGTVFFNTAETTGAVTCRLYDADTGALLASASRLIAELSPAQYTMFSLGGDYTANRFRIEFTAAYESGNPIQLGCSREAQLAGSPLTAGDETLDSTIALKISFDRIGGFTVRLFWLLALPLALLLGAVIWLAGRKNFPLHRLYLVAVVVLGLLYNTVLPPYASPDEMFHINQAFNNSSVVLGGVERADIHWGDNYKRPSDKNALVQDKNTTVFTYREIADNLFTASPDKAADTVHYAQEEVGGFNLLYLFSSLGVLLGRLFGLGFVPTLMLGRLFNFAFFTCLTVWAVKITPVGKSIFAVAGLLPMTLHLAMSFNRDCVLLALAFAFTAQCFRLAYDPDLKQPVSWQSLATLGATAALLAPGKVVYFPLCALFLIIPTARFGDAKRARLCRLTLAACALLPYLFTSSAFGVAVGVVRSLLASPAQAAQAAQEAALSAVAPVNPDSIVYNMPYILSHLKETVYLTIRSFVENSSFYLRTLLGDSLGYYSVHIDPVWLIGLFAVGTLAVVDSHESITLKPRTRLYGLSLTLAVFALVVLGCILWTPTYYTTIYGIQGRYLLPALPLLLACLKPAGLTLNRDISRTLVCAACALQAGVILNVFLVVLAR